MLHHAAILGYEELVEFLLTKGASTGIEDNNGTPPLAYAERTRNERIVQLLLEPTPGISIPY